MLRQRGDNEVDKAVQGQGGEVAHHFNIGLHQIAIVLSLQGGSQHQGIATTI